MPDFNTIAGVLRAVVPAALAYAVGRGWLQQAQVNDLTAAIITIAAALWSIKTNQKPKQ